MSLFNFEKEFKPRNIYCDSDSHIYKINILGFELKLTKKFLDKIDNIRPGTYIWEIFTILNIAKSIDTSYLLIFYIEDNFLNYTYSHAINFSRYKKNYYLDISNSILITIGIKYISFMFELTKNRNRLFKIHKWFEIEKGSF